MMAHEGPGMHMIAKLSLPMLAMSIQTLTFLEIDLKVEIGQSAPDVQVLDMHGEAVSLSSLWKSGPVLLYFHRHLGCIFTKQAFKRLDCSIGQLESHGVRIISIVPTNTSNANAFCTNGDFWHTCLVDMKLDSYKAYGVPKANLIQMFGPKPINSACHATKRGYRQSIRTAGNAFIMSAVIVIDASGIVKATWYSSHIGDIPSLHAMKRLIDVAMSTDDSRYEYMTPSSMLL